MKLKMYQSNHFVVNCTKASFDQCLNLSIAHEEVANLKIFLHIFNNHCIEINYVSTINHHNLDIC